MRLRFPIVFASAMLVMLGPIAAPWADTGFSVNLNGAQEVPANASPGTGSGTLVVNDAQTQVTYNITYQNLTSNRSAQHIHAPAPVGQNAGVAVGLSATGTTSGTVSGVAVVTTTLVRYMVNDSAYVNIHTANFPGGEIRGQIMLDPTPTRTTTWGRIKQLFR
ncbi:MAG TPA: CHRD domain-containing protein [Candidatus Eisenbacteria bacterium]